MDTTRKPPVIFLAFANDRDDRARYLRNLPEELRSVRAGLSEAEKAALCEIVARSNATVAEVLDVFQDVRYRDRIAVFHYGGHAGGLGLFLESPGGAPEMAHADGLAEFLGRQRGLELVFLNGCSTQPQVEALLAAGVRFAIATSESIDDAVAMQLAERFYSSLASGAAIAVAWSEAVAAVKTSRSGSLRDLERVDATSVPSRWPWDLHVREGAEIVRDWSLPKAAGNPLWGVPEPPITDLPEAPYRHLAWYGEDHAAIFFGRDNDIRILYDRVLAPDDAPILLFCGQSGVGKSSLLAAGLTPRLRSTHEVIYVRRQRDAGLEGTLRLAIGASAEAALEHAWMTREHGSGRPLVVILDQVEEVFTRPGAPREMDAFVRALETLFAVRERRPRGRLILSFRKEWLVDIEEVLRRAALPRARCFLDRLGRDGIVDIIEGPTRSPRLRQGYGLSVETGLAALIADDLLVDPTAPVAPTLAVLLSKLWQRAITRNPEAPRFDSDMYADHRLTLLEFLDEQMAALGKWNGEVANSGLALDVLACHTTPLGTSEHRGRPQLADVYAHREDVLQVLIDRAIDLHLLASADGRNAIDAQHRTTRLAHDTLAPLVRLRFDESDRPGQRARRILESRGPDFRAGRSGALLTEADLETVEAGAAGMRRWDEDDVRIIEASQRACEQQRKLRRRWQLTGVAAILLIAASAVAAGIWARAAGELAHEATSLALAAAANAEPQTEIALLLAVEAARLSPGYETLNALASALQRPSPRLARSLAVPELGVEGVVFSPDGRLLVSGGEDRTLRFWDLATRRQVGEPLMGHAAAISSVALSRDGTLLASGDRGGTVRLWDAATRQPIGEPLMSHEGEVLSVAFRPPDGRLLASCGDGGKVRLWEVTTQRLVGELPHGQGLSGACLAAFSPDGRLLVSGSADGTLRFWDVATRQPVSELLTGHERMIASITFSPDGRLVASGDYEGRVLLWDVARAEQAGEPFADHLGFVHVAFSSDGRFIVSGGEDRIMQLWNAATRQAIGEPLAGHTRSVSSVAFSPDDRVLVSSGHDGTVRIWDLAPQGRIAVRVAEDMGVVTSVAFSPDGQQLVSGNLSGDVRRWDIATRRLADETLTGQTDRVQAVAYGPDGQLLQVSSDYDEVLRIRNVETGELVSELPTGLFVVREVALGPNGRLLATSDYGGTVQLWNLATGQRLGEPLLESEHRVGTHPVAFSPDGQLLASSDHDGTVRFWDVATRQEVGEFLIHSTNVSRVGFSPDGRILVSGDSEGTLRLWDVTTRQQIGEPFTGHTSHLSSVAFSPAGSLLASGGTDHTVRLWDVATGLQVGEPLTDHAFDVSSVAFSPDGQLLASGSIDGTVRLWNLDFDGLACSIAGRNLPITVWERWMPGREYRLTCPELPPGRGAEGR